MSQIEFDQIQGNSFGGFSKDHQQTILLQIAKPTQAAGTLAGQVLGDVKASSSAAVLRFNGQFKALRRARVQEGTIKATWTNLLFTHDGLEKLGAPGLAQFPKAFREGMKKRSQKIGDTDRSTPAKWNDGLDVQDQVDWDNVHAMVIVASDDPAQLDPNNPSGRVGGYLMAFKPANSGLKVLGLISGETRVDQPGHEHFGFKDGVSQPGIRGVTPPDDPVGNPDQGNPGQDLLHPGEFVIGYPRQIPHGKPEVDGPNPEPGIVSGAGFFDSDPTDSQTLLPDWARNGSFLVFRRLAQDVGAFRSSVNERAAQLGISDDLFGAKLVGRYRSGAPLEKIKFHPQDGAYIPPQDDPGLVDPGLANNDSINNDFEFGDDAGGQFVPRAAHIRKAYPRDEVATGQNSDDAESETQTHRLLRRGIPFGKSWSPEQPGGARGLLFFAYQSDIERQFEFVQQSWVNNANFPQAGDGQDPIIAQSKTGAIGGCPFHPGASASACAAGKLEIKHFINTKGGGYFFSPSIGTLETLLGGGQLGVTVTTDLAKTEVRSAVQIPGQVTLTGKGKKPTAQHDVHWEQTLLDVFPPQFRLVQVAPGGNPPPGPVDFEAKISFRADEAVGSVIAYDSAGGHEVQVQ